MRRPEDLDAHQPSSRALAGSDGGTTYRWEFCDPEFRALVTRDEDAQNASTKQACKLALRQANQDNSGLYDLIWEQHALYPKTDLAAKYSAAAQALRILLERRWVELYLRRQLGGTETLELVESRDVSEALSRPWSWYPDCTGNTTVVKATFAGELAWEMDALEDDPV